MKERELPKPKGWNEYVNELRFALKGGPMNDIREKIAQMLANAFVIKLQGAEATPNDIPFASTSMLDVADQILSIPVTVPVPCDKCGGSGHSYCAIHGTNSCPSSGIGCKRTAPCTCTNGKREAVVILLRECDRCGYEHEPDCPVCGLVENKKKPLSYFDLGDSNIREALFQLEYNIYHSEGDTKTAVISNNKGTLRLEVIDER